MQSSIGKLLLSLDRFCDHDGELQQELFPTYYVSYVEKLVAWLLQGCMQSFRFRTSTPVYVNKS